MSNESVLPSQVYLGVAANLFTPSSTHMPPLQGFYRDDIRYEKADAAGK